MAEPVPDIAAEGRRLRRRRLLRCGSDLRHARRFRRDARRRARARHPHHRRPGSQSLLRPARLVPAGSRRRSRKPRARALHVPRRPGRRRIGAAEQLGVRLRRPGVVAHHRGRRHGRAVVPAPVRRVAARLRLVQPRGAGDVPRGAAVLARPRRRRVSGGCGPRPGQGGRPARLHAAGGRRVNGWRRGRRAVLGSAGRARDLARLAPGDGGVRRRPRPVR